MSGTKHTQVSQLIQRMRQKKQLRYEWKNLPRNQEKKRTRKDRLMNTQIEMHREDIRLCHLDTS